MRIHVVVNRHASKVAGDPSMIRRIESICEGAATLHVTASLRDLASACECAARDETELIVLCGGDGSAMAGTTAIHAAWGAHPLPAVVLASGGSSCTVARNWGRLLSPPNHVAETIARANAGKLTTRPRPTLLVRQSDGTERIGYIFGTGLVASFFRRFYARGGGGYREASWMIGRIVLGSFVGGALARQVLSPMPCRLKVEGWEHPASAFTLIVCAVVPDLGLRLRVTHRAAEDPMRPHLVASNLGLTECGLQYARVLRGRPLMHGRTVDRLARNFRVCFAGQGAYVLDGDLFESDWVEVRAGPMIRVGSWA